MLNKFFGKLSAAYQASPFHTIMACVAIGLLLGFGTVAISNVAAAAPVHTGTNPASPWTYVDYDNFHKVSNKPTYDDYQKYHADHAASDAGVVMLKTQIQAAPGSEEAKADIAAQGHTPVGIIAVSEEDAQVCHQLGACTLISPQALKILNEKLKDLERAQRKGAACT